jgi:hypothetical protein
VPVVVSKGDAINGEEKLQKRENGKIRDRCLREEASGHDRERIEAPINQQTSIKAKNHERAQHNRQGKRRSIHANVGVPTEDDHKRTATVQMRWNR